MLNLNIMLSNVLATLRHKSYFFSKQATEAEMKNGVAYRNQDVCLQINIYLNKTSTLPFRPVLPLYRNQSTGLCNKSMGWFLYNGSTGLK